MYVGSASFQDASSAIGVHVVCESKQRQYDAKAECKVALPLRVVSVSVLV